MKRSSKTLKNSLQLFSQIDKLNAIYRDIESFLDHWKKEKVAQLVVPHQSKKYEKIITLIQWTGLFATTTGGILTLNGHRMIELVYLWELLGGGILTLNGHRMIGGSMTSFFPLFGALIFFLREKNEARRRKWENFVVASEKLGNNLDELVIVVDSLQNFPLPEKTKKELESLRNEVYDLLKEYDKNSNQKIDVAELKIKSLALDLRKKWSQRNHKLEYEAKSLREIMLAIQNLEKEMSELR